MSLYYEEEKTTLPFLLFYLMKVNLVNNSHTLHSQYDFKRYSVRYSDFKYMVRCLYVLNLKAYQHAICALNGIGVFRDQKIQGNSQTCFVLL